MPAPNTTLQRRYRIIRQLGRGGMGTVYEAVDRHLNYPVAIKETHATTDGARRAFEREAALLAYLRHSGLPKVMDHFTEGDSQYLVMEFIAGTDLEQLLAKRRQSFSYPKAVGWADQLLAILEYLHTREPPIIHRDIKPSNLKLSPQGEIILLDFGLAKGAVSPIARTATSMFGYTLHYAPFEQIQGEGTGPKSDLYALSATLYHLLTAQMPADSLTRAAALLGGERDPLIPLSELNHEVPLSVAAVLMSALSLKSAGRPESATQMRGFLRVAARTGRSPVDYQNEQPVFDRERNNRVNEYQSSSFYDQPTIAAPSPPPIDSARFEDSYARVSSESSQAVSHRKRTWPWVVLAILSISVIGIMASFYLAAPREEASNSSTAGVKNSNETAYSAVTASTPYSIKTTNQTVSNLNTSDSNIGASPDSQAKDYYEQGVSYTRSKQYYLAIQAYQKAINSNLKYAPAYAELGYAYNQVGRYDDGAKALQQSIELNPGVADVHRNLAASYRGMERWVAARDSLENAVRLDPQYAVAWNELGFVYRKVTQPNDAVTAYRRAVSIKPDYAVAHYGLGLAYLDLDDRNSALGEYEVLKNLNKPLADKLYELIYK